MHPQNVRLRTRLAEIDEKITRLQNERAPIQEALDALIYPVLTLPTEITSEIFAQSVANRSPAYPDPTEAPLLLASVCSSWRSIAIHDTRLWGSFRVKFMGDPAKMCHTLLRVYLGRSGTGPLDMHISGYPEPSHLLLQDFISRSSQWREVTLNMPLSPWADQMDFSSLETLTIASSGLPPASLHIGAFAVAPKLRAVTLQNLGPSLITLPWSQLTNLKVNSCTLALCLEVVQSALALVDCAFHYLYSSPEDVFSDAVFAPHLHLSCLIVSGPVWNALLSHLEIPNLKQLEVGVLPLQSERGLLLSSFARSPELSRFTCDLSDSEALEDPFIVSLFNVMPKLSEFHLIGSSSEVNIILRNIRDSPSLLPCIQAIQLDIPCEGDTNNITADVLSETLSARWNSDPSVIALRSFRFVWEEDVIEVIGVAFDYSSFVNHPQLSELERQGMDIHIGTKTKSWI